MVNKLTLQNIINKYHLGEIEAVKWEIEDKNLNIKFQNSDKEVIGSIEASNMDIQNSDIPIFDTKKLLNLLSITSGDLLIEIENEHLVPRKLHISDKDFNLTYALADMLLIPKVGTVNEPDWDVTIELEKEDISNLIKAKSALSDVDNMLVTTELDLNEELTCKFTFGDESGYNNKITYQLYGEINIEEMKIPFKSNLFRMILNANKESDSGLLQINQGGLMKLKFTTEDVKSTYYILRKEDGVF